MPIASVSAVTRVPVRDDLSALEGYHSPQVTVRVRLNTNESPFPPPESWRRAFSDELAAVEWHRYPDRSASALREGIARLHGVRPDQVFVANGSNEVLQTVLLTFTGPGRTVATFEPTYQLHGHIARLTGATVVEGERAADFTLDLAEVHRVLGAHSPTVTFLCSPNNPTGLVEPESNVREVLAAVQSLPTPGLLVVDEAYGQFADWSALGLVDDDIEVIDKDHKQSYGKIAPIDEPFRRFVVENLSQQYGVYSLGRFATWRNILLDDVLQDMNVIKKMVNADSYTRKLHSLQV